MKKNKLLLEEGMKSIITTFVVALLFYFFISEFIGSFLFLASLVLAYIYRNPSRHIFENTKHVLAPIDGVVRAIDRVDGQIHIYTEVALYHTHIVRAPKKAKMQIISQMHGLHFNPSTQKASKYNEQLHLQFDDVGLDLVSGLWNQRIDSLGERDVTQGEKIVVFLHGMAVIKIAEKHNLSVGLGDKLTAGQTVLF